MKTLANDRRAPFLPATAGRLDLGSLPLGSAVSRAAARRLLEQKEAEALKEEGLRFQAVDIVTGEPVDLEARARRIPG
jgi:hypothetical protein